MQRNKNRKSGRPSKRARRLSKPLLDQPFSAFFLADGFDNHFFRVQ
jgi:hypothetical protein